MGIQAQIAGVHDVLYDLTESQRDDGQVVAGQTQDRDADQHAEQARHNAADYEGHQHGEGLRGVFRQRHIGQRAGERADAHEAGVAQAQFAQDADGQVQRNGQDNVSADRHQLTGEGIGQCADCTQNLNEHVEADDDTQRNEVALGGLFHIFQHSSHLKPSH